MTLLMSYRPDMNSPELIAFAQDPAYPGPWKAPIGVRQGYSLSTTAHKQVGSVSEFAPGKPICIYWARQEWYVVTEGHNPAQVVGNFDVVVPWHQVVSATVSAFLLIKDSCTGAQRTIIESAFSAYKYPADGDPDSYIAAKLATEPTITRDLFLVDFTHSVEKQGSAVEHPEQRDAILAVYRDQGNGSIKPGPNDKEVRLGDGGYFKQREINARLFRVDSLNSVPAKQQDSRHQIDNPTKPISDIITDIAEAEGNVLDCNRDFDKNEWKILTLFSYPEFKVDWRNFSFEIGCGVWIVVTLPVLQTRTSELNLWAYTRSPKNLGQLVGKVVEACAWRGALSGAVVGVVLGNFIAALQAFRAVFTECLKEKLGQFIQCLIPGLALINQIKPGDDWRDV
ncbi:MAG TPA: hypothetical protein PK225_07580 [Azonexus sp.]|nr:hypothetical protein [Azonexus sp.]HRH14199.1 hypothetical protein [Azonexus sp.]